MGELETEEEHRRVDTQTEKQFTSSVHPNSTDEKERISKINQIFQENVVQRELVQGARFKTALVQREGVQKPDFGPESTEIQKPRFLNLDEFGRHLLT